MERVLKSVFCLLFLLSGVSSGFSITNGSFEQSWTDWRTYAVGGADTNFTIVEDDAYAGNLAASIEVVTALGDTGLDRYGSMIPVEYGDAVGVSFAAKTIFGSANLVVIISEYNAGGVWLGANYVHSFDPDDSDYSLHSFTHLVSNNSSAAYLNLSFTIHDDWGLIAAGHYYVDDIQLYEGDVLYNGGFEDGANGWRPYIVGGSANFGISNDAYEGNNAFSFDITSPGIDHGLDRWGSLIPVDFGSAVGISFAAKAISTGSLLNVTVGEWSVSGSFLGQIDYPFDIQTGFYSVNELFHSISNPATDKVNIAFNVKDSLGNKASGHYLIDDVQFSELPRLFNGNFEEGLVLWRTVAVSGGLAEFTISNDAFEGNNALSLNVTNASGDQVADRFGSLIAVSPNEQFGLHFAAKKISGVNNYLSVTIEEYDSSGTMLSAVEWLYEPGPDYSEFVYYYTVSNSAATSVNVGFRCSQDYGVRSVGHYLIDDVNLFEVPKLYNGGFEEGQRYWRAYSVGGAIDFSISSDAYKGSNAALVAVSDPGIDHGLDRASDRVPVDANEVITVSFASKKVSAGDTRLELAITEVDEEGNYLAHNGRYYSNPFSSAYEVFDYSYKVRDPNAASVNIAYAVYVSDEVTKSAGTYLIDDIKMPNPQMILNPGFERGWVGWRGYSVAPGAAAYTLSSDSFRGLQAAEITVTSGGGDHGLDILLDPVGAVAGDKILVTFAAKKLSSDSSNLHLKVSEWIDTATPVTESYAIKAVTPGNAYEQYSFYYEVQDGATDMLNVAFGVFDSAGEPATGTYLVDEVRLVKGNGLNIADINFDLNVDVYDLRYLASSWLDSELVIGPVVNVDDFESYSDQSALIVSWQEFYWASFNGSTTTSSVSLLTSPANVYSGAQSMRWVYDANDVSGQGFNFTDIVLTLDEPIDLRGAESVKVLLNRHAGNSQENILYIKFFEGAVDVANIRGLGIHLSRYNGSTYSPVGWAEWTAMLDDYIGYDPAELDEVTAINIGCYSPEEDSTAGSGVIDIDDIRIVYPDYCASYLVGDINGDCQVDFTDFAIMGQNWLDTLAY